MKNTGVTGIINNYKKNYVKNYGVLSRHSWARLRPGALSDTCFYNLEYVCSHVRQLTALKTDCESNSTTVNTSVIFNLSRTTVISWCFPFVPNECSLTEQEQSDNFVLWQQQQISNLLMLLFL